MKENETVFARLEKRTDYALNSKSITLAYEAYGAAKMAFELGAITREEFFALNEKLVVNGMNNPSAGLR